METNECDKGESHTDLEHHWGLQSDTEQCVLRKWANGDLRQYVDINVGLATRGMFQNICISKLRGPVCLEPCPPFSVLPLFSSNSVLAWGGSLYTLSSSVREIIPCLLVLHTSGEISFKKLCLYISEECCSFSKFSKVFPVFLLTSAISLLLNR